jgi:hypothetical protein
MSGLLRAFVMALLAVVLSACGTHPKPDPDVLQVFDIRAVAVTANAGISSGLLRGIKLRLDRSIHDTVRPAPLPTAVMNINVVANARTQGYDGIRTETEVSVVLSDITSGHPVLMRSFVVYSFSINARDSDDAAAEAIAARLRIEYQLSQPTLRKPVLASPRLSTRMNDDTLVPLGEKKAKPVVVVIPLKTAPVLGADQDPMLNSKTKTANDPAAVHVKKPVTNDASKVSVEDGAKVKVVINPKPASTSGEPCVETMDKKC